MQVESQLAGNVRLTILTMCAAILIATCILMRRSFRLTYSITKPISEILHNIKKVGKGEYKTINKVPADCIEIQELDAGTRKMAEGSKVFWKMSARSRMRSTDRTAAASGAGESAFLV